MALKIQIWVHKPSKDESHLLGYRTDPNAEGIRDAGRNPFGLRLYRPNGMDDEPFSVD